MSTRSHADRTSGDAARQSLREAVEAIYLPNPEQIEQRAAEIRAGWSARDYRRRGQTRRPVRLGPVHFAPVDNWSWNDA